MVCFGIVVIIVFLVVCDFINNFEFVELMMFLIMCVLFWVEGSCGRFLKGIFGFFIVRMFKWDVLCLGVLCDV